MGSVIGKVQCLFWCLVDNVKMKVKITKKSYVPIFKNRALSDDNYDNLWVRNVFKSSIVEEVSTIGTKFFKLCLHGEKGDE